MSDERAGLSGAERITAERRRQIEKEGWTSEHDDEHEFGQLAAAAACYAGDSVIHLERSVYFPGMPSDWPWRPDWWKPELDGEHPLDNRIRNLEKAGALIAAEIDRLLRLRAALADCEEE